MRMSYPRIETEAVRERALSKHPVYAEAIERILNHVCPKSLFEGDNCFFEFDEKLPLIAWTPLLEPPFELSFFMLCRFRSGAFRFFYEMVSRWLIPGKRMNALMQFAINFSMPQLCSQKYSAGEVVLSIETAKELEALKKNLPIIENEMRLGLESYYQACRILEIKGLTTDEKTAFIQQNIAHLVKLRPQDFDYDILSEMQHFLVLCKEEFKQSRSWRHMSRIICVHYLFQKALRLSLEIYPERRYINVKLIRTVVNQRKVLGIAIGMSFLGENERFEASHILCGIQALLPGVKKVEGSLFHNQSRSDSPFALYLEIEKENGQAITLQEERLLKEELPFELKNRIEQRLNPIFMPQNEEMIMRHIVTLGGQLKYLRDLPQVIIDFAQQTEEKLEFLVVAVRVVHPKEQNFATAFEVKPTFLEYLPDRTKMIGWLRKKYKKEASVFRLRIQKKPFLRKDHSVDLNKARQEISKELKRVMGEFRDYNGGTLSKENELFEKLGTSVGENPFLLESFFYSINPPIMRSLLPAEPLIRLFKMILEAENEGLAVDVPYQISMQYEDDYLYMLITARDLYFPRHLLYQLKPFSGKVVTSFIQQTEYPCFGLIFRDPDAEEALRLRLSLEQTLAELYIPFHFKSA